MSWVGQWPFHLPVSVGSDYNFKGQNAWANAGYSVSEVSCMCSMWLVACNSAPLHC